ncbi:hypothetical protein J3B02_001355 [Coemansia erecta]|uniref:Phosphoribosyltransferase domain-containing protein n=1 Tax=Coemansia asiatica TaxID=1052880 RepID=A0A9W7XJH2_9FUNG|nr:hypothetical protein LPJ64_004260 [Coemansia asiatica]KAJ2856880.1 hypothetical protein J3B02_001355 [Coemansia erecta]KAJ2888343.1 hypothetical protein FB639_000702 [Coemansia asiatica]
MVSLDRRQSQDTGRDRNRGTGRQAVFSDRIQAGQQLAGNLQQFAGDSSVVVLSISRGGAVVGSVIAESLGPDIPHLYYVVRAIPCATMPRLSLGSVAGDGSVRVDNALAKSVGVDTSSMSWLMQSIEDIDEELSSEQARFHLPAPTSAALQDRTLIVVDDGIEAGDMMREAIMHLRHCYQASKIVVAVPVCLADLRRQLQRHVACVVDIVSPIFVGSIARWYALGVVASEAEQRVLSCMFAGGASDSGFDVE